MKEVHNLENEREIDNLDDELDEGENEDQTEGANFYNRNVLKDFLYDTPAGL